MWRCCLLLFVAVEAVWEIGQDIRNLNVLAHLQGSINAFQNVTNVIIPLPPCTQVNYILIDVDNLRVKPDVYRVTSGKYETRYLHIRYKQLKISKSRYKIVVKGTRAPCIYTSYRNPNDINNNEDTQQLNIDYSWIQNDEYPGKAGYIYKLGPNEFGILGETSQGSKPDKDIQNLLNNAKDNNSKKLKFFPRLPKLKPPKKRKIKPSKRRTTTQRTPDIDIDSNIIIDEINIGKEEPEEE